MEKNRFGLLEIQLIIAIPVIKGTIIGLVFPPKTPRTLLHLLQVALRNYTK